MARLPAWSLDTALDQLPAPAQARAADLFDRYRHHHWRTVVRPHEFHENLFVLDQLDRWLTAADRTLPTGMRGLDVGAKNFAYLGALVSAAAGAWDGVELDAHRRYRSGQTRASVAAWRLGQVRTWQGHYIAGSVAHMTGSYRLVTWFLPFVTLGPHRSWGLPPRLFAPEAVLRHVWELVAPSGALLITNQGADEAAAQGRLFAAAGIDAIELGPADSLLSPFRHPRHGWLARRPPN